jgi:hypothetical protein
MSDYQNDVNPLNAYAHCPTMPIHTPLNNQPLNCNIPYDFEKQNDNYIFPSRGMIPRITNGVEHFQKETCSAFLIKLIFFVAIMFMIIYLLCKE